MAFKLTKSFNQRLVKHLHHKIAAVCHQNVEITKKFKLRFKFQANEYEMLRAEDEKTSKPCLTLQQCKEYMFKYKLHCNKWYIVLLCFVLISFAAGFLNNCLFILKFATQNF